MVFDAFSLSPMVRLASAVLALLVPATALAQTDDAGPVHDIRIVVVTTKGEIHATLFASRVPMTVANFVNLAHRKYYDGIVFHRVIPDFMVQVGDPLSKDPRRQDEWGTGGPGYEFNDEIDPSLKHNRPGVFSMANAGKSRLTGSGTNGSQIFITHLPTPHLDGKHSVFGNVTQGQDIVNKIAVGDKIVQIKILDDPAPLLKSQSANVAKWNSVLDKSVSRR